MDEEDLEPQMKNPVFRLPNYGKCPCVEVMHDEFENPSTRGSVS
jgi:hypothetical protein